MIYSKAMKEKRGNQDVLSPEILKMKCESQFLPCNTNNMKPSLAILNRGLWCALTPFRFSVTFPPWRAGIIPPGICLIRLRTSGNPAICWSVRRLSAPQLTAGLVTFVWQMDAGQLIHLFFLSCVARNKRMPEFAQMLWNLSLICSAWFKFGTNFSLCIWEVQPTLFINIRHFTTDTDKKKEILYKDVRKEDYFKLWLLSPYPVGK